MLLYILFSLLSLALGFVAGVLWDDDDSSILDDDSWLAFANTDLSEAETAVVKRTMCWGCWEDAASFPNGLCDVCDELIDPRDICLAEYR